MFEKTGTPSCGQPVPAIGSQLGEEYRLSPTSVIGSPPLLAPTTYPAGRTVGPFGPYGRWNPAAGITVPAGMMYWLSAPNGAQVAAPRMVFRSRQLCGLPWLMS